MKKGIRGKQVLSYCLISVIYAPVAIIITVSDLKIKISIKKMNFEHVFTKAWVFLTRLFDRRTWWIFSTE